MHTNSSCLLSLAIEGETAQFTSFRIFFGMRKGEKEVLLDFSAHAHEINISVLIIHRMGKQNGKT